MPEVILPCPFCGNTSPRTTAKKDGVWCDKEECPNRQNTYAIDVWNALPRALRWTHEPPKVAGWYWRKETAEDRAHVFHFTGNWEDYGEHWGSDRVCQLPLNLNDN